MTTTDPNSTLDAVLAALGNPKFKWRTIPGVAKTTGLSEEIVRQAMAKAADQVVRSAVPSADGQDIFTTRDRFRDTATLPEKLIGAVKNRAM